MADDQTQPPQSDEPTIPPAPPAPFAQPGTLATPLAPPIGAPQQPAHGAYPQYPTPGQHPPQPAHPAQQPAYPQPQYAQHPPSCPLSPGAPAGPRKPTRTWLIVLIAVGAVAALIIGTALVMVLVIGPLSDDRPQPVTAPSGPSAAPTWPGTGSDEGAGDIGAEVQAKIDQYENLRDTGALWQQIPDDDVNRTAVQAFLYLLIDMKSATSFGIDGATAQEYRADMAELERLLLAQQPLGTDIEIDLGDGRVFRYDGTTGEGGYVDE